MPPKNKSSKHAQNDRIVGEEVAKFSGTYLGSMPIVEPYGRLTCKSFATRVKNSESIKQDVEMFVTYDGLFLCKSQNVQDVFMSCNIQDISYIWRDIDAQTDVVFITHQYDPVLIECHLLRITSTLNLSAGDDMVKAIDKASLGKFPGALAYFDASYSGSVSVNEEKGKHVVKAAAKRIKAMDMEPRSVTLVIYEDEIKIADHGSQDDLKMFPILDVSFTALDSKDARKFSFITKDSQFGLLYCHLFDITGESQAEAVPHAINEAFAKVTEKLKNATPEERKAMHHSRKGTSGALGVFDAKYIGSVSTKQTRGNEAVEAAMKKAQSKKNTQEMVSIIVTADGIRTIEALTGEVKSSVFTEHVTFVTTMGDQKQLFGFISEDVRLKRKQCHIYDCGPGVAGEVTESISKAFKILKEKSQESEKNPFLAAFSEREPVPGSLLSCQVHRNDLTPDRPIGAGQFGKVYLAKYKKEETLVAVKTVRLAASEDDKEDFVLEAEVMKRLKHENLVNLIGVALQQRPWLCVIEFIKYGDLRDVLESCKEKQFEISFLEQLKVLSQICAGLGYIASCRFIHMDVAARNCLLDVNNRVKVADFGLTRKLDKGRDTYTLRKTAKLPVRWLALEAIETGIFSELTDVWAFGVLVWEVLSYGELPFADIKNIDMQNHVRGGGRLSPPAGCNELLFRVAQSCWEDEKTRPNFAKLVETFASLKPEAESKSVPERDIGKAASEG
eukprot:m.121280 g.121280  ORF g.121280 m.121280 type:complete len:729 (+) comp14386_c0_seq4:334-2520(+)